MRSGERVLLAALMVLIAGLLLSLPAGAISARMGGTFTMTNVAGTAGSDLLPIVGNENSWEILLEGVVFECTEEDCPMMPGATYMVTTLRATSFDFQFSGPDAAVLNSVVASQLTVGGHGDDGYFEVALDDCLFPTTDRYFHFYILPDNPADGTYWSVAGYGTPEDFALDGDGCPIVGPFVLDALSTTLYDFRGSNDANIYALNASTLWLEMGSPVSEASWGTVKALYR